MRDCTRNAVATCGDCKTDICAEHYEEGCDSHSILIQPAENNLLSPPSSPEPELEGNSQAHVPAGHTEQELLGEVISQSKPIIVHDVNVEAGANSLLTLCERPRKLQKKGLSKQQKPSGKKTVKKSKKTRQLKFSPPQTRSQKKGSSGTEEPKTPREGRNNTRRTLSFPPTSANADSGGDLLEVMPVDVDGFTVRGVPYDNSGGTDDIRGLDLTLYERVEFRRTDGSGEVFSLEVGTYVVIEDRRHHLVRVFIQHGNPSTVELIYLLLT